MKLLIVQQLSHRPTSCKRLLTLTPVRVGIVIYCFYLVVDTADAEGGGVLNSIYHSPRGGGLLGC